ncbi:MAG: PilZ domain-containing protein [Syntrophobacteraceae bacterium]
MNPIVNRRKEPRFRVGWSATLTCRLADREESVEVKVTEVSLNGARLLLKSLKIGPHHIVAEGESLRLTLKVNLTQGAFVASVRVIWYSTSREKGSFDVGVIFMQSSKEHREVLENLISTVALAPGSSSMLS